MGLCRFGRSFHVTTTTTTTTNTRRCRSSTLTRNFSKRELRKTLSGGNNISAPVPFPRRFFGGNPSAPSRPYVGGDRYPRWMNPGGAVTWPPGVRCSVVRLKRADLKIGGVAAEYGYCVCRLLILHCMSPIITHYCRSHAATWPFNMPFVQGIRGVPQKGAIRMANLHLGRLFIPPG